MKRVLVTGGSGFVGANLARHLLAAGHEVHLLLRPGRPDWRWRELRPQVRVHWADLGVADEVEPVVRAVRPDWVFHLAAFGAYPFQTDINEMVRVNAVGTTHLVHACCRVGIAAMVHGGSSSEYGFKDHPPSEWETAEPNSDYASTKVSATQYCQHAARAHGVPIVTARLYSAYGPFEDPRRLVPTLLRHAQERRWPPLADPATSRDFVFIDDVCEALVALAQHPPADPGAIFNVGSGKQTSLQEIVSRVAELFEVTAPPAWNTMPSRAWDTGTWVANPARITSATGWKAKTSLDDGLRATANWLRAHPELAALYQGAAEQLT